MTGTPGSNYSRLDRLLHKWALSGIELQKSLADIEDRIHARRLQPIALEKPIFIAALPRAGTTLLLDLVARLPGFVTHTYRSMPFVLCPILWDSVSRGFRKPGQAMERAHADGMTVTYDSPEAFEEVLWKAFWPKKYSPDRIALWTDADRNPEFEQFFRSHMRKLIALDAPAAGASGRYISKNNANIARFPLLRKLFPDCILIVPFRDPVDQAGSLLRQHRRFVKIHGEDAFTRFYMDAIGHFEFGAGMRAIDFPDVSGLPSTNDPAAGDFWLSYWIRAYSHLARLGNLNLRFVDFDAFCAAPLPAIAALARELECASAFERLSGEAGSFHSAVHYDPAELGFNPNLVTRARELQDQLRAGAIN